MSSVVAGRQVAAIAKADAWKSSLFYHSTAAQGANSQGQGSSSKRDLQMAGKPLEMPVVRALKPEFFNQESNISYSSGSEHDGESLCLDVMVSEFLEDSSDKKFGRNGHYSDDENENSDLMKTLKNLTQSFSLIERELLGRVQSIVEALRVVPDAVCRSDVANCEGACLRRAVMTELRSTGYDAAVCKTRWEQSKSSPGGDYEFVDVTVENEILGKERVVVDVDFREQFRIARPSALYSSLLSKIPNVFVGKIDRILHISDLMSESARESARRSDMYVPPWRKPEYMRLKWSSQYKRTVNELPSSDKPATCAVHAVSQGSVPTMISTPAPTVSNNLGWVLPEVSRKAKSVKAGLALALTDSDKSAHQRQGKVMVAAGS